MFVICPLGKTGTLLTLLWCHPRGAACGTLTTDVFSNFSSFPISEYNGGESHALLGRKRGQISFLASTGKRKGRYEHNGRVFLPSKFQGDGGNVEMRDVLQDPSVR